VTIDQVAAAIQLAYPQIYYACHTRHTRGRSTEARVSLRDSEILIHLDTIRPTTLSALAGHMDLAASTLSEATSLLEAHGYVVKRRSTADRREVGLALTVKGLAAVRSNSVLETARLRDVLERLSARERLTLVRALNVLARACRARPARPRARRK
jgi:DNA-binding MarR family transcriptional regulator